MYVTHIHLSSWNDELLFPMLVKNAKTGERNVLQLSHLEAENVPEVSPKQVWMIYFLFTHNNRLKSTI